ncbi:unnamed protein product [Cladocopium goreaui]|uniref:Glutamate--cysteine ligase n=1 Tax=Cladocopium goreaui TaxID=2562237 RepID=A0A9P1C7G5_9DINO|nr:unnamed protein product [Cladocopium goreaui]
MLIQVIAIARVLAQQILEERWDVYQPISKVEENLRRSEGLAAVTRSRFHFRRDFLGGATKDLGDFSLEEILFGDGHGVFARCLSFMQRKHEAGACSATTLQRFTKYVELFRRRCAGELPTPAAWLRQRLAAHKDYAGGSVVPREFVKDMVVLAASLSQQPRAAPRCESPGSPVALGRRKVSQREQHRGCWRPNGRVFGNECVAPSTPLLRAIPRSTSALNSRQRCDGPFHRQLPFEVAIRWTVAPRRGVDRYGGNEAASIEDMHAVNDPAADTAANFMGREAPRNVSQRKSMLPGQRPWNAFKRGTQIIVLLWSLSVIWALVKSVLNTYDAWKSEKEAALRDAPQHIVELPHFFTPSLCAGLQDELQRSSHVLPWSSWTQAKFESPVLDAGCGWDTAEDVSLTCDATSCTAALLQRGGRNVTLCTAIPRGGQLTLTPLLSWTLTSGASPLRNLALQIQGESLHIYAATHQDGLLLLRPRGEQLRPVLEVETSKERGSWTPELLLVLKDVLFSFRPEESCWWVARILHLT